MKNRCSLGGAVWVLWGCCSVAQAQGAASAAVKVPACVTVACVPENEGRSPLPVGSATRRLLLLQAQGEHASAAQYPMPGAVAQQVYQRYLKSFAHPVPEQLGSTLQQKK